LDVSWIKSELTHQPQHVNAVMSS